LRDADTGMPTLVPSPVMFGLPSGWSFDAAASEIRTERFSPFNGKRRLPDLERQLVARGSVLVFRGDSTALSELVAFAERGIGECVGTGFGEVELEPGWMVTGLRRRPAVVHGENAAEATMPNDELFGWAKQRASERDALLSAFDSAARFARQVTRWGIRAAQWGMLRALARERRELAAEAFRTLIQERLSSGIRAKKDTWGRVVAGEPARKRLLDFLGATPVPALHLEYLAELAVRAAKAKEEQ